jgi:hypothetical protein
MMGISVAAPIMTVMHSNNRISRRVNGTAIISLPNMRTPKGKEQRKKGQKKENYFH